MVAAYSCVTYSGEITTIDKSSFDSNSIPNQAVSMAGGLYLQGSNITMTNSSVTNNTILRVVCILVLALCLT